jgi:hypothetical protein
MSCEVSINSVQCGSELKSWSSEAIKCNGWHTGLGKTTSRQLKLITVIPRYTSKRFTRFRLYEMHKLIPVFQFTSQYELLPLANRSLFPSGSNGILIFVLRVFVSRAVSEERIKLVNRGITVFSGRSPQSAVSLILVLYSDTLSTAYVEWHRFG